MYIITESVILSSSSYSKSEFLESAEKPNEKPDGVFFLICFLIRYLVQPYYKQFCLHISDDQNPVDPITSLLQDFEFQALFEEFVKIKTTKSAPSATVPTQSISRKSLDKPASAIPVTYDEYRETEERTESESNSYDPDRYSRYLYTFDLPDDLREALRVSNFVWVHYIIQTI